MRTINAKGGRLWQIRFIVNGAVLTVPQFLVWLMPAAVQKARQNDMKHLMVKNKASIIVNFAVLTVPQFPAWSMLAVVQKAQLRIISRIAVLKNQNMFVSIAGLTVPQFPAWLMLAVVQKAQLRIINRHVNFLVVILTRQRVFEIIEKSKDGDSRLQRRISGNCSWQTIGQHNFHNGLA